MQRTVLSPGEPGPPRPRHPLSWPLVVLSLLLCCSANARPGQEHVIVLHGLCRSSRSMEPMCRELFAAGYSVTNVAYPSRHSAVQALSDRAVGAAVEDCRRRGAPKIHFVAHSLGGILVRSYFARHPAPDIGRVVMLGPPNQGTEIVDRLGSLWLFSAVNGPAGRELGTSTNSVPNRLGAPSVSVGVIAGKRSINWINSLLIPGPDDGKVSVKRTRLPGMADHIVIPATHGLMMRKPEVIRQTVKFLQTGAFDHPQPPPTHKGVSVCPPRFRTNANSPQPALKIAPFLLCGTWYFS